MHGRTKACPNIRPLCSLKIIPITGLRAVFFQIISDALEEYRAYYSVYSQVFGEADTRMTRSLKDYLSEYEYRCIAYDKGAILFDMLRGSIGDKKFFSGLKKYYSAYRYKVAAPEDLIVCFERTGVDVAGFFDSFLSGKAVL